MRARRRVVPALVRRRLAVLRVADQHLHRPVPPPDRRPDQHRRRRSTRRTRWAGTKPSRPTATVSAPSPCSLQEAGYTTGFVGKFLNRYEYVPGGEVPEPPPGWSDFNVLFGSAYDGWGFSRTYVEDGVVNVSAGTRCRRPTTAGRRRTRPYAGTRHPAEWRSTSSTATATTAGRGSSRSRRTRRTAGWLRRGRVPGRAGLPAGVPRPARRRHARPGTAACWTATTWASRTCPGFGDDLADNAPASRATAARPPRVGRRLVDRRRDAGRARPARPGPDGAVDRPDGPADPALGAAQHLCRAHLRQRLPRRPASASGCGKGAAYESDIRVPLLVVGSGRPAGRARPRWSPTSTSRRRSRTWPGSRTPRYRSGLSLVPTLDDPTLERQRLRLRRAHLVRRRRRPRPAVRRHPRRWCRRTSLSAAATRS